MTGVESGRFLEPSLFVADAADVAAVAAVAAEPGAPVRLRGSHCASCDRWEFPALTYCPICEGAVTAAPLSEFGRVGGVTAVLHAPPDVAIDVPYTVALVDFPEGLSVLGIVPGVSLERIDVGNRVRTVAAAVGPDIGYGFQLCD